MIKTHFLLTDRFGQDVQLTKTYSDNIINSISELELLLIDFDCFISSLGYPKDEIDTVKEKIKKLKGEIK